ncbi:MAG: alpha/beta fold hydrolase [Mycolicibacterium sp.]|uniref:alpha/beta fold hydrolase n=1 Tax=Mycolicibacterium sp. TaxID=2320850 RepID=UPI003D0C492C
MEYSKKSVTSKDGTTIGFRQFGRGPAVVILHGGALASQHYMKLGTALADEFTVCIPDRRGRGMSGPYGPDYSINREDEDLAAVVAETGARCVFGTADGGLFALHGSMSIPAVRKVAVFEPVVFVGQPGLEEFKQTISRGEALMASGDIAGAMSSLATDAGKDPRTQDVSAAYRLLGGLATQPWACRLALWLDAVAARGDKVPLRDLVPALIPELQQVRATEGTIEDYRRVTAECLLMCGRGAPTLFTGTADALQRVLPQSTRVELPGCNHGAAQDQGGNPAAIAEQLRLFFSDK